MTFRSKVALECSHLWTSQISYLLWLLSQTLRLMLSSQTHNTHAAFHFPRQ